MNPLRLGIIGCGNVLSAYRAAADKLRARGWAEVALLCGREAQRAAVSAQFPGAAFTTDAAAVYSSPQVDIVVILTSMPEHARLAIASLEAGKHVLVEKPIATSLSDAAEVVAAARQAKGHLLCAPFTILSPTFQQIGQRLRQGQIGQPCLARARYGWAGPDWSEWFYKPGGGCLFDLAVYCFTSLTGLLGPARRVTAMAGTALPEREIQGRKIQSEVVDNAQVLLDFGANAFAVVTSGFTMQQYRNPGLEIYGTTGTIQMLGDDWDPDGFELWQNAAGCWQVFRETDPEWPWTDGLRHLVECVRAGQRPVVVPEHARHVLEIMLRAETAAKTGQAQALETTFTPLEFAGTGRAEPAHLMHDRSREHS